MVLYWDEAYWDSAYWDIAEPFAAADSLLRRVLTNMEQRSKGVYPWQIGVWDPGMWENNTVLRKNLKKLEI